MKASTKRSILRWIHIILAIPIAGIIYGDPAEVHQYIGGVQKIVFPAIVLTGLWMWKGDAVKRLFSKRSTNATNG
ncbi:MAG TPA: hypothetical protein VG713_19535 [Pirellulales bacterium]|nr:hypothetical protein [Pirellulales bacterium]